MSKNTYEKRKSIYNSLVRPDGKPLNDQDKVILDLLIQFTKNKKIGTTTYKYLLDNKFPNKDSSKTVNRTLKNISLYIYAKFKKKVIIDDLTHINKIAFCRVPDFDTKMSASISKPCNTRDRENWTQGDVEVDNSQNENWTKMEVDTGYQVEEQAVSENWTQGGVELDKKRVEVDKNVQVHIEEGNIYSPLKGEYIISEEKEKSKKKKKKKPSEKMSTSSSLIQNLKIKSAEKCSTTEILADAAKTSYAFGGDKVLPQNKKSSKEYTDGNLALAKKEPESDTDECVETAEPWLAKGENDNAPVSLATLKCVSTERSISETKPAVKFHPDNEESDSGYEVKQTLSCEDYKDAKWQSIRKFVLEKFKLKEELAYGILHNMMITAIRPNRIGLKFTRDLGFSEEDKEVLRSCLRDVYGPTIEILLFRPDVPIDVEKESLRVHVIDENDKRLPAGLKKQFEQLDEYNKADVAIAEQEEELVEPDEIRPANKELSSDLETKVFDRSLAFAKHKWNDIRRGILDGVYGSYAEQMENYLSNVEVLGMSGKTLRLEAWWLTCDKMKDQQDLVERIAKKCDVNLEIKNRDDVDILYMPWTYPSQELPPLELESILKRVK